MMWYGIKKTNNFGKKSIINYKKKIKLKVKSNGFYVRPRINLNLFKVYFYLPSQWNFIAFKRLNSSETPLHIFYIYTQAYFFFLKTPFKFVSINYDRHLHTIVFNSFYKNNFYNLYWSLFKNIFYSFSKIFFKKLKFKGKGYYIYKNLRNTIAMQFGYSHRLRIYSYFLFVKFITKTSILLFGVNKEDVMKISRTLRSTKPINIFTGKGIRFTKQIIYKKTGKVSSYR